MKTNNVFLAQIVSFSRNSLLFNPNELAENINIEEFRLVELRGNWAYDLINYKRYYLISDAMNILDDSLIDSLKPNVLYAYKLWSLIDIWEDIVKVYNINVSIEDFLEKSIKVIDNLEDIINTNTKTIDFQKIKKLMIEGK